MKTINIKDSDNFIKTKQINEYKIKKIKQINEYKKIIKNDFKYKGTKIDIRG